MELSIVHPNMATGSRRAFARPARIVAFLILALTAFVPVSAMAETPAPAPAQAQPAAAPAGEARNPDKLYVDADEIVYDKDKQTVIASGNVALYYKGRTLQADRVVYDRQNKRFQAQGHAKFVDEHGNITYAPYFDLTDDFANGFANGVQVLTTQRTRFSSPHVERSGGDITTMDYTTYTACEPCKAHPEWPPEWQIRAGKIIEDQ